MSEPIVGKLRARGLAPKKRFGQNFLTDQNAARAIAMAATPEEGGTVLEIGAGTGALTRPLLARAGRVVAVERDRDLVPLLQEDLAEEIASGHLTLIEGDALAVDWLALLADGPRPHVVAGNLPYLITGALIERATAIADAIDVAVFMVQAEVADRLIATPGSDAYGALTVFVQAAFSVRRVISVKSGSFFPKPDVDSAVVAFTSLRPRRAVETGAFRAVVKGAFGMRRKTLRNAWKGIFGWSREELDAHATAAGISLDLRGETLAVEDFERLAARAPTSSSAPAEAEPERASRPPV